MCVFVCVYVCFCVLHCVRVICSYQSVNVLFVLFGHFFFFFFSFCVIVECLCVYLCLTAYIVFKINWEEEKETEYRKKMKNMIVKKIPRSYNRQKGWIIETTCQKQKKNMVTTRKTKKKMWKNTHNENQNKTKWCNEHRQYDVIKRVTVMLQYL